MDHLACTEIRAANLSGDCFMAKEFFNRLNFNLKGGQQVVSLRCTPSCCTDTLSVDNTESPKRLYS